MAKFNWGAALTSAGDSLSRYGAYQQQKLDQQAAQDREDRLLQEQRAWTAAENDRMAQDRFDRELAMLGVKDQYSNANDPWVTLPGWGPTEMKYIPAIPGPVPMAPLWGGGMAEVPMPVRNSAVPGLMNNYWDYQTNKARSAQAAQPKPVRPSIDEGAMLRGVGLGWMGEGANAAPTDREYFYPGESDAVRGVYHALVAQDPTLEGNPAAMARAKQIVEQSGGVPFEPDMGGFVYEPNTGMAYNPQYEQFVPDTSRGFWTGIDPGFAPTDAWKGVDKGKTDAQMEFNQNRSRPAIDFFVERLKGPYRRGSIDAKDLLKMATEWGLTADQLNSAMGVVAGRNTPAGTPGGFMPDWSNVGGPSIPQAGTGATGPLAGRKRLK